MKTIELNVPQDKMTEKELKEYQAKYREAFKREVEKKHSPFLSI